MNNMLNFMKIILIIDTIILLYLVVIYSKTHNKIDKELKNDREILSPIIHNTLNNVYSETRNKIFLKDIKEVYHYEQILLHRVETELIHLKNIGQLKLSRYMKEDEIEVMIKYEISKLNIMVDKYIDKKQNHVEEKQRPTTVDISDSLMM